MSEADSPGVPWEHPVFDIFILGTRSSGKTVLLSSLYQKLSSMDGVTNFYARCDDMAQHRELCEGYDGLLDTEADWPTGTYQVENYNMRCFHRLRGQSLPVFSLRFHEYPGGYVSSQTDGREFLETRAASCHSVTALIDGRKVLARLEGKEVNPAHSLHKDLDSLVRVLQQCAGKPIHFVVTKGDLLDPGKYPLRRIVSELSTHRGFQDIVEQQRESGASCYVIPVSAVGPRFTVLDPEDGTIRKRHDGTIDPFNLDVMIGAAMSDGVMELSRAAASENLDTAVMPDSKVVKLHKKHGRKLTYGQMLAPASSVLFGPFGMVGLIALFATSQHYLSDKSRKFEDKVRELRGKIADRSSALESITHIQFLLLERFLRRFPEASVGARFDPTRLAAPRGLYAAVSKPPAEKMASSKILGEVMTATGSVVGSETAPEPIDLSTNAQLAGAPPSEFEIQVSPESAFLSPSTLGKTTETEEAAEDREDALTPSARGMSPMAKVAIGCGAFSLLTMATIMIPRSSEKGSEQTALERSCPKGDAAACAQDASKPHEGKVALADPNGEWNAPAGRPLPPTSASGSKVEEGGALKSSEIVKREEDRREPEIVRQFSGLRSYCTINQDHISVSVTGLVRGKVGDKLSIGHTYYRYHGTLGCNLWRTSSGWPECTRSSTNSSETAFRWEVKVPKHDPQRSLQDLGEGGFADYIKVGIFNPSNPSVVQELRVECN